MKRITVFLLFITITSCQYFNVKKTTPEAILEEEQKAINWNDVDVFPTFSICDSLQTSEEKTKCFQNTISNHVSKNLQQKIIIVSQDVVDILKMELLVSEEGVISVKNIEAKNTTLEEIPDLKNMLEESLIGLPKIFPAIKRGQQVKTQFELPIILEVN